MYYDTNEEKDRKEEPDEIRKAIGFFPSLLSCDGVLEGRRERDQSLLARVIELPHHDHHLWMLSLLALIWSRGQTELAQKRAQLVYETKKKFTYYIVDLGI